MKSTTKESLLLVIIAIAIFLTISASALMPPVKQDSTTVRIIGRDTVVTNVRTGIVFIRLEKYKCNGKRK